MEAQNRKKRIETERAKLVEFFATLDLKCEVQTPVRRVGPPAFVLKKFGSEENFWNYARHIQQLGEKIHDDSKLVAGISLLLESDPLYFLVLMHLHRQIRFTNLELVNMLFDRERLDDANYYKDLIIQDPAFADVVNRISKSRGFSNYFGAILNVQQEGLQSEPETELSTELELVLFKKAITMYLGPEERCWHLWESRLKRDAVARMNVARFVVENEDLKELIHEKTVVSALIRSLRIVNVELVKRERGEYGSNRVRRILEEAGFRPYSLKGVKDISDVERNLPPSSDYLYLREVPWKEQDKVFDFVLVRQGKIGFVIETNYFTTSMSKIREVVRHFRELKVACRGKYRLIYITDGMGWFNLMSTVRDMVEFEQEELEAEPSKVPYLMNLEMFRRRVSTVKSEM